MHILCNTRVCDGRVTRCGVVEMPLVNFLVSRLVAPATQWTDESLIGVSCDVRSRSSKDPLKAKSSLERCVFDFAV